MKKLLFTLSLALVLITSTDVFANSAKFGFLSDRTQSLNSLRFFCVQNQSARDTGTSKYMNRNLRLKGPLYLDCSNLKIMEMMDVSMSNGSFRWLLTQQSLEKTSPSASNPESLKLKDPNVAAFYALVPGFFFHGAGHFYAGKSGTGLALLGVEMLSIASFYLYGLASLPDGSSDNFTGQAVFLSMAVGLFLGSWYYDIEKTPQAVKEYNEKLRTKTK